MMTKFTHLLGAMLLALLAALSVTALSASARAQEGTQRVITNTASAEWTFNGQTLQLSSNRVDLRLDSMVDDKPVLSIYRISRDGDTRSLAGASCTSSNGSIVPFQFQGIWAGIPVGQVPLKPATEIKAGEPLIFGVAHSASNRDPNRIDTKEIVFDSAGDAETVTLVETGPDTGFFMGALMTRRTPPAAVKGDCALSVNQDAPLSVGAAEGAGMPTFAGGTVSILIDPFGIAFDSGSGENIPGVKISVVDAITGAPAEVYGDDGISRYPSTVFTGETVTDSGGTVYDFPPGDYRFPLMPPGRYRLLVEPVAPYTFASERTAAEMAELRRPDGQPFAIIDGSYGGVIELFDPAPVRVDIPLDRPGSGITLTKTASEIVGEAGDTIQYQIKISNPDQTRPTGEITLTDIFPAQMRLREGTVRVDGKKVEATAISDGTTLKMTLPRLSRGASTIVSYALEIRADADEGNALNRATATDSIGNASNVADALVRIERDSLSDKMTIIGRVVEGTCSIDPDKAPGIAGVRIMLEDGSYAVTDIDGRYHFEGVEPGTHVVQLDDATLVGMSTVDCAQNTRSAGRSFSRFVEGRGGSLKRVDFRAVADEGKAKAADTVVKRDPVMSDQEAAGTDRDWFADQKAGVEWLYPTVEQNPRAPVTRVAIKHLTSQTVKLYADGKPVNALSFDGAKKSGDESFSVSVWRSIPLEGAKTVMTAEVLNADGSVAEKLERIVYFSNAAFQAELLPAKSHFVADGVTRPVIAVRLTDRNGRPVHHGLTGDFQVPAPYYPAVEKDAQQVRQLAGLERARPVWRVEGDDGIAYIELEPTTASGALNINFAFRDGEASREQRLDTWLEPGDRPWTIVGLAEGTVGYNKLQGHLQDLKDSKDGLLTDGRLAFYAKGKILGKWLMTLSYDTDKKEDDTDLTGVIDPKAYYTIYADTSERRYDAASVRKLYLRLERKQFYALFGDYQTGIHEPELARYVRSLNGVKAEYGSDRVSATAFAADTPSSNRRDEIQGNGLSGPYALGARDILANSETIYIEVRDRERSDRIIETRQMTRYIDYEIDYLQGIVRFKEPILSRTTALDPQFIIAQYEVDGIGERKLNAGGRASWRTKDQKLQVSATAIHDSDDQGRTLLGGADVRYRPTATTEVRAEVAVTDSKAASGSNAAEGTSTAWLVEAEHHGARGDVIAYVRQQDAGFGVGQISGSNDGTRKLGVDGRYAITENLLLTGSAWHEDYLASEAARIAARGLLEYRGNGFGARAGVTMARDRVEDGRELSSTILQFGANKSFLNNRLEVEGAVELPIGGQNESADFPARYRAGARYAITRDVRLVGGYEIADGATIDSRTAKAGFELSPWAGARILATGNLQNIAEYGPRSYAAFGLAQSFAINDHWSADLTVDSNKTVSGIDPREVLNEQQPVASGGQLSSGTIAEDFTALTAGATYRSDRWSVTGRAEYRMGDAGDRYGVTLGAIREIGEGQAVGGALNYLVAESANGAWSRVADAQFSWAHRPADSRFSFLDKVELRSEEVRDVVTGQGDAIGIPSLITGDASSVRVINSLSLNWSPTVGEGEYLERSEFSLFWGSRFASERLSGADIKGWSNVVGVDARFGIGSRIDIGGAFTVRQGLDRRSFAYSGGPSIGISPFENGWLSVGWNVVGFEDRDFEEARYTRSGPYATMRLKFDQHTLQGLGLGR